MNKSINPNNITKVRDIFLDAEAEYLEELKQDTEIQKLLRLLSREEPEKIFNWATAKMNSIENGQVAPENLEKVEKEITLLLASISDTFKTRIKNVKESYHTKNINYGR